MIALAESDANAGAAIGIVAILFFVLIGLVFLGAYVISIVWAFGDAQARGKSGCLVALLVALLSWPLGLIIWLVARPDNKRSVSTGHDQPHIDGPQ